MDIPEILNYTPGPGDLVLRGRAQHEIALSALNFTGVNEDFSRHIAKTLESHAFIGADLGENTLGLRSVYAGDTAKPARTDLMFSLMIMAEFSENNDDKTSSGLLIEALTNRILGN